ncbi:MAG: site-2 protease family protein [Desulfovibrionaceae bacterium]|nr:site-2 protease family protein [Desulfovibrionaceae bacterium]
MDSLFTNFDQALRNFSIAFIPAFLGIILHEVGHGWMALRQGDITAKFMGRLTLNPIPHIDPLGLAMFVLTSLSGSFVFGWAKPVPINPRNFARPRQGLMWVALAGPCTNFLLALICAALLKAVIVFLPPVYWLSNPVYEFAVSTLQMGILINLGLGVFNLVPIPPLDGSKVVSYFLPPKAAYSYLSFGRYGFIVLILLIATGILSHVLLPLLKGSFHLILSLFAIA